MSVSICTKLECADSGGPATAGTLGADLQKRRDELRDATKETLEESNAQQRVTLAVRHVTDLNALDAEIARFRAELSVVDPTTSEKVDLLNRFEQELSCWRQVILGAAGSEFASNARALYSDAGSWANHFSVVRMTVSTFFITAAWGLVSVKWQEFSQPLAIAASCIWLLAGFFLCFFTDATYWRSREQKRWKNLLAISGEQRSGGKLGWPTRLWRTITFDSLRSRNRRGLPEVSSRTRRAIWLPFWAYLVVSAGFGWLLYAWGESKPSITWSFEDNKFKGSLTTHDEKRWRKDGAAVRKEQLAYLEAAVNDSNEPAPKPPQPVDPIQLAQAAANAAAHSAEGSANSAKAAEKAAEGSENWAKAAEKAASQAGLSSPAPLIPGLHHIQEDLRQLGYDPGEIDGKDGRKTRKAAREFCSDAGLAFPGKWYHDQALLQSLAARLRNQAPQFHNTRKGPP